MKRFLVLFVFSLIVFLTACSPITRPEQLGVDEKISLDDQNRIGQTFVAEYDGLMGVEIMLQANAPGVIRYHLQADDDTRLTGGELALDAGEVPIFVRLPFAPQPDSNQVRYGLSLETDSVTVFTIRAAPGAAYLNGSAYQNGEPLLDAQLAFRLVYDPGWLLWGLVKEGVTWLGWICAAGFLFVLPGWSLLAAVWPGWGDRARSPGWAEKLALAGGVGLAVYPVLFAWAGWVDWGIGRGLGWVIPCLSLFYLLWKYRNTSIAAHLQFLKSEGGALQSWVYLVVLGLLFGTRFWAIRHLEVGLWGDSVHHTLITQLMVAHGGLFDAWAPYNDLQSFTYHFGFHSGAALFHWLTGMAVPRAVVVFGQVVNVMAVWALIPLGNRLTGLPKQAASWAGVGAVILAGLLVNMPAFYVNWGRYTQLAGQAILPVALWLVWDLLDVPSTSWWQRGLIGWVLCGLALTHYRVMIFAAAFFIAFGLVRVWRADFRAWVLHAVGVGGITGLFFAPWFFRLFAGKLFGFLSATLATPPASAVQIVEVYNQMGNLQQYLPAWAWWGMLACFLWGVLKRNGEVLVVGGWCGVLLLIANPGWLGLPGTGAVNNFSVLIAAYLPAGWLVGAGLAWGLDIVRRLRGVRPAIICLLLAMAVWGGKARLAVVDPVAHALAARPDIRAGAWIQENLPEDARLLVNSFAAFGETSVVGSDGGWWMSLLGKRQTTLPPILYVSETGPRADYISWVNDLTFEIQEKGVTHPDVITSLARRGVTHVYIGQQQGRANWAGPVIEPGVLFASPHFRPVYHVDRVWVFEFLP